MQTPLIEFKDVTKSFGERIQVEKIFRFRIGNWWRWDKKEMGVCPVLL